jgi:hypothetical protein
MGVIIYIVPSHRNARAAAGNAQLRLDAKRRWLFGKARVKRLGLYRSTALNGASQWMQPAGLYTTVSTIAAPPQAISLSIGRAAAAEF